MKESGISTVGNSRSPKLQRCFNCQDWITLEPTALPATKCPYCEAEQSSLTYDNEFDNKILADGELQLRDNLLRSLRIWQFKYKNNCLMPYQKNPPYFKQMGILKKKED